ncbi:alpha-mannosidase [Cohnella sp.]|uniref:alpha-mannosidase n=1 Tax=Cohnella sp. TaxID=1883426 RepID=UPI003566BBBE
MKRIIRWLRQLNDQLLLDTVDIREWKAEKYFYRGPGQYEPLERLNSSTVSEGDRLAASGETIVLKKEIFIDPEWSQKPVKLLFKAGGEGLLRINGKSYHGLDRNRSLIPLPVEAISAGSCSLEIELYNPKALPRDWLNEEIPPNDYAPGDLILQQSKLALINEPVQTLIHTVKVYADTAALLPEEDLNRSMILSALYRRMDEMNGFISVDYRNMHRIAQLERELRIELEENTTGPGTGMIHMIGQSHIDVAWLWPLKETVRKSSRTFSTACAMLDEYPQYHFTQSQPQLYEYVKQHDPKLYERIKQKIAEGRWEVVGGMWIEPDLNIPSGESLVRQLLYGSKFLKEEFGIHPRIEWLPDTFGYCASLPQILIKAGIEYFMTTKMYWSETNLFPYDLFHWKGIDGTTVLTYINHGLNEEPDPHTIKEHWKFYKQKTAHPEQMLLYGYGDGGGGVTREMVEQIRCSSVLPGLPKIQFGTAHGFFDGISKKTKSNLPVWVGEMYLEKHRGTYTTHARNKKWNRKSEVLYRQAEIWNTLRTVLQSKPYPYREFEAGWKKILLNQFHDIIPGSSIPDVYTDSQTDYEFIFNNGEKLFFSALSDLAASILKEGEGVPYVIFNSLSWERTDNITIEGGAELLGMACFDAEGNKLRSDVVQALDRGGKYEFHVHVPNVPSLGYKTVWLRNEEGIGQEMEHSLSQKFPWTYGKWETRFYRLEFDGEGRITSWFDKQNDRELVVPGQKANDFQLFHDLPLSSDAWDLDDRFGLQPAGDIELLAAKMAHRGKTRDILRFRWNIGKSHIIQDIIFYHDSRRVDFVTKVSWQEEHKVLKVAFPVDVLSSHAAYEIPFGSVERPNHSNTSWEQAQFEVCAFRWADLSEAHYGVSLLNDCKYGYDIKGNHIRLTLLRAPKNPDPTADIGDHEFTYSLYPHRGDWRDAKTVRQGIELNCPLQPVLSEASRGTLPSTGSFVQVMGDQVILETLKMAEDGQNVVMRLYESEGGREQAMISADFLDPMSVSTANLLEQPDVPLEATDSGLNLSFMPYEIKTILIKMIKQEG